MNNISWTKPPVKPPERGGFRISIRYKILALFGGVLIAAIFTYLLLAVDLFNEDKLAYVYDLNSTLAKTVGEEVRSAIGSFNQYAQSHRFWSPDGRYLVYAERTPDLIERVWLIDTRSEDGSNASLIGEGTIGFWSWN